MMNGLYMGKILRVDLTKETVQDERLPEEKELRKWVGGVGLAMKYLYDEVSPDVEPLDPDNRLILMTGPLTGTVWPCSGRHVLVTTHADLPKSCGTAWGGGMWAAKLKFSGYDGIIIQGQSKKPVYLSIHSGRAELRDASNLWGKETIETEETLQADLEDPQASVLCIGPAGENLIPGSSVHNDRNHTTAKAGGGVVMGSKKLKAISVSGRMGGVRLASPKEFMELALEFRRALTPGTVLQQFARNGGGTTHYNEFAANYRVAVKNFTDEAFGLKWAAEVVDTVRVSTLIPRPCFNCPLGCSQDIIIGKGPYKGYRSTLGGGAENMEGIAGMIGVDEGGTVLYLTDLADRLGLESGQVGQSLAILYECYEKGIIDKKFTEGLELKWGNADAAIKLLNKVVKREGLGKLIAEGPRKVGEAIGSGADQFVGGAKGLAVAHDYRCSWELVLGIAVAQGGPVIEGLGVDRWGVGHSVEPDLGWKVSPPPYDKDRAPLAVSQTQKLNRWNNNLGICLFSVWGVPGVLDYYTPKALYYGVGWNFGRDEALLVGERTIDLMRVFNLRRGLTVEDDLDVGPRQLDGYKVGPLKDKPIRPHIRQMVSKYYEYMGWDPIQGIPSEDTLRRVGLEELIKDVRKIKRASPKEVKKNQMK